MLCTDIIKYIYLIENYIFTIEILNLSKILQNKAL